MTMNWTKRRSIALVLLVTWVLYGAYLYPLPTARIARSAQELHTEHLTWIEAAGQHLDFLKPHFCFLQYPKRGGRVLVGGPAHFEPAVSNPRAG